MYSHLPAQGTTATIAHCKAQDLPVVDRLIEPQTIVHFLEFALGQGPLPNGTQPSVTRLAEEEIPFLQANFPPGSDGHSILDRIMARIGSEEDGERLCLIGKNLQFLKTRLWEGVIPMTQQRWQEKQLDKPEHFDLACQHLTAVVSVFQYLNQPVARNYLRITCNLIYDHWTEWDTLLNRARAKKGEERISVAALWTMYMSAQFEMMTERAHRWVIVNANALRAPIMNTLVEYRPLNESAGPDQYQWKLTDSLHMLLQITADADYIIMIPMEGFKGYVTPTRTGPKDLLVADCFKRGKAYHDRMKILTREYLARNILASSSPAPGLNSNSREASGGSYHQSAISQIQGQNQLRIETRGPPIEPIPREPWITSSEKMIKSSLEKNKDEKLGMAVYRLTYEQSETEWAAFVKKLDAHVSDWGKGQTGSNAIRPNLKLHWFDGKDLGIAENDIDAAKKHFNSTMNKEEGPENPQLQTRVFFAIDSTSYASYTTNLYGPSTSMVVPGDFTGFLLAVDPDFDPEEGIERPDESPEYSGQMRVLGSLIWSDLYSLFSAQAAQLEDFWPLAMEHPNQVYVGPTIPWQLYAWRKQSQIRWELIRELVNYRKRQMGQPELPRPPVPTREPEPTPVPFAAAPVPPTSTSTSTPQPQQPGIPRSNQNNLSASMEAANPPEERDPVDGALRAFMLNDFRRYLRERGQDVPAAMASELLSLQPGEQPDGERMQQRAIAEQQRQEQRRRDGLPPNDEQEDQPQCPLQ
ncbi:uncharacterized protein N7511_003311 [Penicillium nucicola]|uniref:uncharacterized protein n=1 Tax=Penicillium nucicola TaxID=1850975 RepID=UPI002544FF00|nr:uncharacterized protein N7511_003311 [Penicillium nucicola]KAJ5771260.1 hypothetical protein N7511_003311 [Penicillium nucicola]